ncbi:MAG: alpha/beta hydrolase [Gaiellaceae bacterium]|nr:MAG: alpha/beta hydrolase [Gaiellaceae bacterium]
MYEAFPDNYGWSLTTMAALNMGAAIGEVDEVCRALRPVSARRDSVAAEHWYESWTRMGERLERLARVDDDRGYEVSACRKWLRAAIYFFLAERHISRRSARRMQAYRRALKAFRRHVDLSDVPVEFVEVPYGESALPSLFVPALGEAEKAPCMIHFNGLDFTKEFVYLHQGFDLRKRGVSLLICDHPGVGEALRLRNLTASPETEVPAAACVDYLEQRGDVDPDRIGIMALSMGGYYAPRAAAFEKRLKCCVVWGAIWDLEACLVNCTTEGTESVSFDDQLSWVFGIADRDQLWDMIRRFNLDGIAERIECPLLVVHGENDRQAPLWTAELTYDRAVNSTRRELKVFTLDEGGAEHCSLDNSSICVDYMHDWIADILSSPVATEQEEVAEPA